ncbi:UNVERIFIED_CONTAM: hypothetical protein FKN15_015157 [Acipenser sinensis]
MHESGLLAKPQCEQQLDLVLLHIGNELYKEFLKKEFSEENILFWQACEIFSHVPEKDKKQLSQRAREIYNSFLSSKATTPVNIDSQAQLADDILNAPRPDMFKVQQLQIFNLMKFDSYTRFLKSPLYQECMLAEVEGRPLPDPYLAPSSPASKHSIGSDRSNLSTPKKCDVSRLSLLVPEKEKSSKHCYITLPDGSDCALPLCPGVSVRELLLGLCGKLCINLAAVDLFLVGGEKSGEKEALDLGVPISSLDGQRVVLDVADQSTVKAKQKSSSLKQSHAPPLSTRSYSMGDEKTPGKSSSVKARGESGKATREAQPLRKEESVDKLDKRKQKKNNIDEAEEFFKLLSKAQNYRANDQRGLLKKEDLVLPDFLRLTPEPTSSTPSSHQPGYRRGKENEGKDMAGSSLNTSRNLEGLDSTLNYSEDRSNAKTLSSSQHRSALMPPNNQKSERKERALFAAPLSPIPHVQDTRQPETIQTVDDENVADLTLVGEGDITSPNSTLLPHSTTPPFHASNCSEANFSPPALCANSEEPYVFIRSSSGYPLTWPIPPSGIISQVSSTSSASSPPPNLLLSILEVCLKIWGMEKSLPLTSPPRQPISSDILLRLISSLCRDCFTPFDGIVMEALCLVASFGFLHCSEFSVASIFSFQAISLPTPSESEQPLLQHALESTST